LIIRTVITAQRLTAANNQWLSPYAKRVEFAGLIDVALLFTPEGFGML
jgi:hypothetical protein